MDCIRGLVKPEVQAVGESNEKATAIPSPSCAVRGLMHQNRSSLDAASHRPGWDSSKRQQISLEVL